MKAEARKLSTDMALPCKVYCGPGSHTVVAGTAVEIDSGSALLSLPVDDQNPYPAVGDRVRLQVLLPMGVHNTAPKCLIARATVVRATRLTDGSQLVVFSFRRANFRDIEPPRKAANGWAM